MTDKFRIHQDHLGRAQAAKHLMLINGIKEVHSIANKTVRSTYPDGRINIYGFGFVITQYFCTKYCHTCWMFLGNCECGG